MNLYLMLTIMLIVLKMTDIIDWSWWIVLMPIMLPMLALLLMFIMAVSIGKEIMRGKNNE